VRDLDDLFAALGRSRFRARQRLGPKEREYLRERGLATVMEHAAQFVARRLAPANPARDGKQTPMHGHPAFIAQHATATCCRGCLSKWHHIAPGHVLTPAEVDHVLAALRRWLEQRVAEG